MAFRAMAAELAELTKGLKVCLNLGMFGFGFAFVFAFGLRLCCVG